MFWIDRNSETENVIVVTSTAILIGSCDEAQCGLVEQQLKGQQSPLEVLGTDDIASIPFGQIQRIISRSTDNDVEIDYKAKKEIEQKSLFFEDVESKQEFVAELDKQLPEQLVKREYKQSVLGAALNPMLSLLLSGVAIYLFINKFRWLTIILGGIWALGSVYMLVSRAASPPTVTRWAIGGRYVRKVWNGLKTAGSYVILAGIIAAGHDAVPDSHGPKSLYEQMAYETLSAESIETLLERGAEINYQDKHGDTALSFALDWGYDDIAIALIEAGADLSLKDSYDMTPIEHAVSYGADLSVVETLLQNGASLDFRIDGLTPIEFSRENEYRELEALFAARGSQ